MNTLDAIILSIKENQESLVFLAFLGMFLFLWTKGDRQPKATHKQKRRDELMDTLLGYKFLNAYDIAQRTGWDHATASKALADAIRSGCPLERIKRRTLIPAKFKGMKAYASIWHYRLSKVVEEIDASSVIGRRIPNTINEENPPF